MQPLFTGSSRPSRSINLSGASSTSALPDARAARLERERLRSLARAALAIQAVWRSHVARQRTKQGWGQQVDQRGWEGGNLVSQTALLLASFTGRPTDLKRFGQFARFTVTSKTLFLPFEMAITSERWAALVKRMTVCLLQLAVDYPEAPQIPLFFELIKQLCDPTKYPPAARSHAQRLVSYLVEKQQLYRSLRQHILGIVVENKAAPSLSSAVSLALSTLKAPEAAAYLPSFLRDVLTIPLLLHRLPAAAVAHLSAGVPWPPLLDWLSASAATVVASQADAINLIVNLSPLLEPRIKTFTSATQLVGWLDLLTACLGFLSPSFLSKLDKGAPQPGPTDMDIDEAPVQSSSSTAQLHPKVAQQLRRLGSNATLEPLLAASARFSSHPRSRPALGRFLALLLTSAPSRARDDVLTLLLYHKQGGGGLLRELWRGWLRAGELWRHIVGDKGKEGWKAVVPLLSGPAATPAQLTEWPLLVLFTQLYARMLVTLGDDEFYAAPGARTRNPIPLDDVRACAALLRNVGFALYWSEMDIGRLAVPGLPTLSAEELRSHVRTLLVAIHERDSRRPFLPPDHFILTEAFDVQSFVETALMEDQRLDEEEEQAHAALSEGSSSDEEGTTLSKPKRAQGTKSAFSRRQIAFFSPRLGLLNNIPFVIPFDTRVSVFRRLVLNDKQKEQRQVRDMADFMGSRTTATIRRNHLADDGFIHLHNLGPAGLKRRLQIQFVDEHGMPESGIDGGGLFKEFLTALGREAFDVNRGLWQHNSNQEVYPAAHSYARESASLAWYTFLGQIVGKALYEGILVAVPFAGFFLSKWLGKSSFIDDLASLDPELYNGLMHLKAFPGDVSTLAIHFAVDEDDMGATRTIDLIPNGRNVLVTNETRFRYITLMSHYRLNSQIREQSAAFVAGLHDLINPRWLRLFSQAELRLLVEGADTPIDIEDLRQNTVYNAIDESSDTIRYFWDVLRDFDAEQRRNFVKFVTAADKAPLLGFRELQPLFGIRGADDVARLPTSSTCLNLLKLPRYHDKELLKQKLLTSITSHSGFDLS